MGAEVVGGALDVDGASDVGGANDDGATVGATGTPTCAVVGIAATGLFAR